MSSSFSSRIFDARPINLFAISIKMFSTISLNILDGEDSGYCKKSIDIIKNLSENRHFNIVAVHTKG
ncbi:hypothetical protein, partial [Escherichia coli]|uniref:hypothetical protein n=1 Tax=Escherichia coli TaxID=562 RepID=UPI003EE41D50